MNMTKSPSLLSCLCVAGLLVAACSGPRQDPDVVQVVDVPEFDVPNPDVPDPIVEDSPTVDVAAMCFSDSGPGGRVCSGNCVDTLSDPQNCGGCGMACLAGAVCSNGMCEVRCAAGLVKCDGRCVDPRTNNAFCGASGQCDGVNAGENCGRGLFCIRGRCETVCPPGQLNCGGNCVDPQTSAQFCGATADCAGMNAGTRCMGADVCAAGRCGANCPAGYVNCNGSCIDPQSSTQFCGADAMCSMGSFSACAAGQVCSGGRCGLSCGTGTIRCGAPPVCVDPQTSRRYCGATADCSGANVGRECLASEQCIAGRCVYFEPPSSEISPAPDAADFQVVDVPRPSTFSVGSILPGTIYYTTDGTEPRPGTGTTASAVNLLSIMMGQQAPISQLRWYMDYGGVYGRESRTHVRLVRVNPAVANSSGFLYEGMRINGSPTALVPAGSMVTVDMTHTQWHSNAMGYCPGCAVIQFQSFDNTLASSTQFGGGSCLQEGAGTFPGMQRPLRFTFTAPAQRGRYAIRGGLSYDFQMACPRYAGGAPIGYFYVR